MRNTAKSLAAAGLCARGRRRGCWRAQARAAPRRRPRRQQPTFRVSVDLVTTDVIVRDQRDQFVADLKPDEFEVFEDGVKQDIVSLVLTHGGRVFNVQAPPPAAAPEGIILPPARPTNDAAGRVFLIFIDDLHLDFRMTPRTRDLMQRMLQEPDPRRRHVRHRHDRHLVDLRAADLRPAGARERDQPRHRRRPSARGHHQGDAERRRDRPSCATARTSRSRRPTS